MKCLVSEITSFIDGDSFEATVIWNSVIYDPIAIRVYGIDCPEMRGKCQYERDLAIQAAKFTKQALETADSIRLSVVDVDYFDRALCHVVYDGVSLRKALINNGLAKAYEGRKRQWC